MSGDPRGNRCSGGVKVRSLKVFRQERKRVLWQKPPLSYEVGMRAKRTVSQKTLQQIIERIVAVAQPEKIILFGSAVREEMGPNSDVDLLVIKAGAHRLDLAGQIYRNLHGVGEAVDVVVVTPEDVERYRESPALVIAPALKEGKVVYAA